MLMGVAVVGGATDTPVYTIEITKVEQNIGQVV
jgi:hypothetical protein